MTLRDLAIFFVISAALSGGLSAHAQDAPPPPTVPSAAQCAKVTASAVYQGYGYTHLVELKNTCSRPVTCRVWTNVDPDKLVLSAKPGETASVATRKGSPSREVTAQSECMFAP